MPGRGGRGGHRRAPVSGRTVRFHPMRQPAGATACHEVALLGHMRVSQSCAHEVGLLRPDGAEIRRPARPIEVSAGRSACEPPRASFGAVLLRVCRSWWGQNGKPNPEGRRDEESGQRRYQQIEARAQGARAATGRSSGRSAPGRGLWGLVCPWIDGQQAPSAGPHEPELPN
jgi:hypothetical protein